MVIKNKQKRTYLIATGITVVVLVALALFAQSRLNIFPQLISSTIASVAPTPFPTIDPQTLTPDQQKVVNILKQEYELQPEGTKYAEGIVEPWCADFVSWVFKEADMPLSNPNSGYWRIPGTYTLREYYESIGKFESPGTGYTPKVGDIMLYDNPSVFGQHTNIVIKNEGGVITTIGGNERGAIRIAEQTNPEAIGFVGYGTF